MAFFFAVLWLFQELDGDLADTPLHGNMREDGTLLLSCASSSRCAEIKNGCTTNSFHDGEVGKWKNGEEETNKPAFATHYSQINPACLNLK